MVTKTVSRRVEGGEIRLRSKVVVGPGNVKQVLAAR
jgi:hypothetical protein